MPSLSLFIPLTGRRLLLAVLVPTLGSMAILAVSLCAPRAIASHTARGVFPHRLGVAPRHEEASPRPKYLPGIASSRKPSAHKRRGHSAAVAHEAIIGGSIAHAGMFPSLAYIVDFQGQFAYQCTGTVIAPSLILTAGHCVENMQTGVPFSASGFRVVVGDVDPLLPGESVSTVLGVIVYPGLQPKTDNGDVALLVLSAPTTAPPIGLASAATLKRLAAGAPATIVGWGKMAYEQTSLTEQLQSATTVVQARKWCRRNAPPFYVHREICTIAPPSYATGVCQGDSGGPLLVSGPNGEALEIGVADHVYGRCSTRHPSVFASVGSISSWIHTWVEAYKVAPTPPPQTPPATLPVTPSQPAPS